MTHLRDRHCEPCEKGGKPLDKARIDELMKEVKAWNVIDNVKIEKNLTFSDFRSALGFMNEVGDIAEFEGHHPDMSLHDWNKVTISLRTHCMKGLSENDFILAAKIDQVLIENIQ